MITKENVEHVAKLARLALNDDEVEKFQNQLNSILEYFDQLNEVNTDGVEPMAHAIDFSNVMREDTVSQHYEKNAILSNAPEEEEGFFKVPKIGK